MLEFGVQNASGCQHPTINGSVHVGINGILFQRPGDAQNAVRSGRTPNALVRQSVAVSGVHIWTGMMDWIRLSKS